MPSLLDELRRPLKPDYNIGLLGPTVFSSGLTERRIFRRFPVRVLNKENVFALERVHLGSAENDLPPERKSSAGLIFGPESRHLDFAAVPIDAVRRGTVESDIQSQILYRLFLC